MTQTMDDTKTQAALAVREEPRELSLAEMNQETFKRRLAGARVQIERNREIQQAIMVENEDFGTIPGTNKPTLLKPGAEKLCNFYGYATRMAHTLTIGDGIKSPPIIITSECQVIDRNGRLITTGHGAANSWERKYRMRKGQTTTSEEQFDLLNTMIKMSNKRALVDATLRATSSSGLFGQDVEDMDPSHFRKEPTPSPEPAHELPPVEAYAEAVPTHAAPPPQQSKPVDDSKKSPEQVAGEIQDLCVALGKLEDKSPQQICLETSSFRTQDGKDIKGWENPYDYLKRAKDRTKALGWFRTTIGKLRTRLDQVSANPPAPADDMPDF